MSPNKLYVLVRRDLSRSQQAVQAAHAVAKWCLRHRVWRNETLVMLQVFDLEHLRRVRKELGNKPHVMFSEPDLKWDGTAIATTWELPEFRQLKLL